jgi:hypothetical protein
MTHNSLHSPKPYRELEKYFFRIVSTQPKELTMLDVLKAKWNEFWTHSWVFTDAQELKKTQELEDYWGFYARTSAYEEITAKESYIGGEQDGTWMEVVDQILDVLGHHYGYNIKEQVYYSVQFPLNNPDCAGYGRELNDEILQQLLLAHPEVYKMDKSFDWKPL